ncbi:hypothetical protein ASG90_06865 [Nocardioides sp. Soil797]|nr:hypothetical protein ASG90_06865 [Nocardioides sp. Soil797]
MKVIHSQGTCGGVEACIELAPDYFHIDEDGMTQVSRPDVADEDVERVAEAVNECPTAALRLQKV